METEIMAKLVRPFCGHGRATVQESPVDEAQRDSGLVVPLRYVELAWAAGIFEGEGTLGFSTRRSPSHSLCPRAAVAMTDRDVVERFREVVGFGTVVSIAPNKRTQSHHKPQYRWQGYGPRVPELMDAFSPFLGDRRKARIADVQKQCEASRVPEEKTCAGCGLVFRPISRYRGRTQIYCDRACGRRTRERRAAKP